MPKINPNAEKGYCIKCQKALTLATNFYTDRKGERINICKKCLTMHVDNNDPETFVWILQKLDVPYVENEWKKIYVREYNKNPQKINGGTVLGRYLAQMKLSQWKNKSFSDSEQMALEMQELINKSKKSHKILIQEKEDFLQEQLKKGEITQEEYEEMKKDAISATDDDKTNLESIDDQFNQIQELIKEETANRDIISDDKDNPYDERKFIDPSIIPDYTQDLTDEDKISLAIKWGTLYSPKEWISLEQHYIDMKKSFDIQDADTEGSLLLICKTYLKMNQALDSGDYQGYKQLSGVYEAMRKSSKFAALQQKKEEKVEKEFNSIGELVKLCEKEGGRIERTNLEVPRDAIDVCLKDIKDYLKHLVVDDLGFGQQIEDAMRRIQIQDELEKEETFENLYSDEDLGISDEDYSEYLQEVLDDREKDEAASREETDE